ncbi:hypothetical protein M446_4104 [Methylobacterium sp. 4-46]|uniref:hypothetical protein n=1 Tax=unclassified Methylobacterium TaxID=2615210 RepID=UPI000165C869|nr:MULTISPECIES: hypothetical protein [Methylobacterium]ACA18462.1 hypothetical protein M446_4104 [Methylobacterium sp. 4-46]WFT77752.1 hypothetical protein QA634_20850 [Methylobacterium nodulans]
MYFLLGDAQGRIFARVPLMAAALGDWTIESSATVAEVMERSRGAMLARGPAAGRT